MNLEKYGPWALLIGGSEGVGAAFARLLAADGFKLVLVARKPGPLEELAEELRGQNCEVRVMPADLSQPDVLSKIRAETVRAHAIAPRAQTAEAAREQKKLVER